MDKYYIDLIIKSVGLIYIAIMIILGVFPRMLILKKEALNNSMLMQRANNFFWYPNLIKRYIKLGFLTRFGKVLVYLHWFFLISFAILLIVIILFGRALFN